MRGVLQVRGVHVRQVREVQERLGYRCVRGNALTSTRRVQPSTCRTRTIRTPSTDRTSRTFVQRPPNVCG